MPAAVMDGKLLSAKIKENAKKRTEILKQKGITPCLAVILAGENPASLSYVKSKENALREAGMESRNIKLPYDIDEKELLYIIENLNEDKSVHGVLVQLPLPDHIDEIKINSAIRTEKDVDCFNPASVGNMVLGRNGFLPCTPAGVIAFLEEYNIPVSGAEAVIVGRSNISGKPLANLLMQKKYNATVTICHRGTKNLSSHTLRADILIAAAGSPGFIKPDMVKKGAAIIDVGINRVPDASSPKGYYICGDADPGVYEKAGFITPVPGGVGLMTVAMLLKNTVQAAENSL